MLQDDPPGPRDTDVRRGRRNNSDPDRSDETARTALPCPPWPPPNHDEREWEECLARFAERQHPHREHVRMRLGRLWQPGERITPVLREHYETAWPLRCFLNDLRICAHSFLPHPSWLPRLLSVHPMHTQPRRAPQAPCSLPDLWNRCPSRLQGRIHLLPADLMCLLCILADPPQFGTALGRYPNQCDHLRLWAREDETPVRLLDVGCGVALGTLELVEVLRSLGRPPAYTVGVTREPLEAWMGSRRILPHAPTRTRAFAPFPMHPPLLLLAADVRALPLLPPFDLIVCNGLIGGPHLHEPRDLALLLCECRRLLSPTPSSMLLAAQRFHEGHRHGVQSFVRTAETRGWRVAGTANNLALHPPPP